MPWYNSKSELSSGLVIFRGVLKSASSAAIEFENQLTKDIANAADKADNLINNLA